MKSNFIRDAEDHTTETKGIAIRLTTDLIQKLEEQDISRNEVITTALTSYFNHDTHRSTDDDIPIEVYEEIYSTVHNTEISPLKQRISHLTKTIAFYEQQINELKQDKQFLKTHCNDLIQTFQQQKKSSFWKRKTSEHPSGHEK